MFHVFFNINVKNVLSIYVKYLILPKYKKPFMDKVIFHNITKKYEKQQIT